MSMVDSVRIQHEVKVKQDPFGCPQSVLMFKKSHKMDFHTIDKIIFLASFVSDPKKI